MNGGRRRTTTRAVALIAGMVAMLAFILTSCPGNRDGMPGRLAQAREEAESAARSGALALDLWTRGRSTRALTAVQLTDARDEVITAYDGVATLRADDPADVHRQRFLTRSMTQIAAQLNSANAAVRALSGQEQPQKLHRELLASADTLARDYR
jgi:hypothetical protein